MFGQCKICDEKDKRILELKSQIEMLQRFALPMQAPVRRALPVVDTDSDIAVQTPDTFDAEDFIDPIAAEADAIFSGA